MGIKLSKNSGDNLYYEIREKINVLKNKYKFWTLDNICENIEFVYYDKLIKFKRENLLNISTAVAYKNSNVYNKKAICRDIINHFKKKIIILYKIEEALEDARDKIYRSRNGPVCRGVKPEFSNIKDVYDCEKLNNSLWINGDEYRKIVKNIKKSNAYEEWQQWIFKLDKSYNILLEKLLIVINRIEKDSNGDNSMTDRELLLIDAHCHKIIKQFKILSNIYFNLVINFG